MGRSGRCWVRLRLDMDSHHLTFPESVSMLTLRPTGLSSCHKFFIPMTTRVHSRDVVHNGMSE